MDTREIAHARTELEQDILRDIKRFEALTELSPTGIDLERLDSKTLDGREVRSVYSVHVNDVGFYSVST